MVKSPYFTTNLLHLDSAVSKDYFDLDSFVIHTCTEGSYALLYENGERIVINKGEAVLIPAMMGKVTLIPDNETRVLETYMELDKTVKSDLN